MPTGTEPAGAAGRADGRPQAAAAAAAADRLGGPTAGRPPSVRAAGQAAAHAARARLAGQPGAAGRVLRAARASRSSARPTPPAWARFVLASAAATGFSGELIPVHPVHRTVFGRPAVASLRDLAEPADLAFVMVPTDAVEERARRRGRGRRARRDRARLRIPGDRRRRAGRWSERLIARAAAHGITLLGPNCLGFLNAHARAGPFALTVPLPLLAGPVGIALQSGALASVMLGFARSRAIGVSTLATPGQRGDDHRDRHDRVPDRGRAHQGHLPVPRADRRSGRVRRRGRAGRPGGQADRRAQGRIQPGGQPGGARPHRVGRRGRRRGRRGAPPAQRDQGDQHRGTADHRRPARLRRGRRAAAGWAC